MLNNLFNIYRVVFVLLSMIILASCGSEPEPINYGHDECEFCRMQITDNKYGAELVTEKGKIYKFDSIECMIEFSLVKNTLGDTNNKLLITDFDNPGNFIDARNSVYVMNDKFRSPMFSDGGRMFRAQYYKLCGRDAVWKPLEHCALLLWTQRHLQVEHCGSLLRNVDSFPLYDVNVPTSMQGRRQALAGGAMAPPPGRRKSFILTIEATKKLELAPPWPAKIAKNGGWPPPWKIFWRRPWCL